MSKPRVHPRRRCSCRNTRVDIPDPIIEDITNGDENYNSIAELELENLNIYVNDVTDVTNADGVNVVSDVDGVNVVNGVDGANGVDCVNVVNDVNEHNGAYVKHDPLINDTHYPVTNKLFDVCDGCIDAQNDGDELRTRRRHGWRNAKRSLMS